MTTNRPSADGAVALRKFPLRVILSVTTGRLLTAPKDDRDNGIRDMYDLLGFLCGEQPWTHTLPRFAEEAKPWLLRWFPELHHAGRPTVLICLDVMLKTMPPDQAVEKWLADTQSVYGLKPEYELGPIPRDDHTFKNPFEELAEMMPNKPIIVVAERSDHE